MKKVVLFASAVLLASCSSKFEGNYADPDKIEIVDDKWNDADARLTAEQMIKSALAKPWLNEFNKTHKGERPYVVVGDFENRTSEQIDTKALFEAVRNELINSGRVRFLDGDARKKILDEYRYQQSGVVNKAKAKKGGKQASADFFFQGAISSIESVQGGYKRVTYKVEMRLTNIETTEIEFTEIKTLTKQFKRASAGW